MYFLHFHKNVTSFKHIFVKNHLKGYALNVDLNSKKRIHNENGN